MLYKRFKKYVGSFCCFVERWLLVFGVVNKCDFIFLWRKKGGIFYVYILFRYNIFMYFNILVCRKRI